MADPAKELAELTDKYKRTQAKDAYERIVEFASNKRIKVEFPSEWFKANVFLIERGYGKTPDRLDVNIENAPWARALRRAVRSPTGQIIETTAQDSAEGDDEEEELFIVWEAS